MFSRPPSSLCAFSTILSFSFLLIFGSACRQSPHFADTDLPEIVDFNFHVKPILSDRCFACHGPDANKREAGLRLDQPGNAIKTALESGKFALVPGSLRKSQIFHRITSQDPEQQMPPPESNLSLTEREIALLSRWIEQGAEYKPHWAFLPIDKKAPPHIENKEWIHNQVDWFVLAKLEENGWNPNEKADKETLLRRVTLDLTGLPPTLEEIDTFLADDREDAYERVVDRLLASDAHAERMAMDWLDIARYADSHGYSQDGYRFMWPWRDWVIQAFKANMPFDQFVTWQIAGDMLPNATKEQRLATAFLRNQRLNSEGGIVPEEYLVEYGVERTATVGTAFMGLTLECARCHDHKYDPVSQKDFYQLYAFFNNVNETGLVQKDGNSGPQVLLSDAATDAQLATLESRIAHQQNLLEERAREIDNLSLPQIRSNPAQALTAHLDFEAAELTRDVSNRRLDHAEAGAPETINDRYNTALRFTAYDGVLLDPSVADFERSDPFSFAFDLKPHQNSDDMAVLLKLASKNDGYRGYSLTLDEGRLSFQMISAFPSNLIKVRAKQPLLHGSWSRVVLTYDGSGKASGIQMHVNGKTLDSEIVFDQLTQSIRHTNPPRLRIGGLMQEQLDIDDGFGVIDNFRVYAREVSKLEARMWFDEETDPARYDVALQKNHYLNHQDITYKKEKATLISLLQQKNAQMDSLPGVMVMEDLPTPRPAYILDRGKYDAPGQKVLPDTPEFILPFPVSFEKNRLGFAKWLFHEDHPLTARVTVNRYWQLFFGQGIVKTTEDFGSQGALPTHPELLDWLATYFKKSGWDLRALQKLIVMSATYQQSSRVSIEDRNADPSNEWLARGPSHRLPAETLRDQVLSASGLLVKKMGGPSVKPYQPEGLWSEKSFFSNVLKKYEPGSGEDLYRRSMYTFWRRTAPPPSMILFDAPTRDHCTVRRQQTSTPLQALVLLNDPQFVEAARVLAAKLLDSHADNRPAQIKTAHRLLTGIAPAQEVLALLDELYTAQHMLFSEEPAEAKILISTGEAPVPSHLDPVTHAALTVVISTIMSFDESVTKR